MAQALSLKKNVLFGLIGSVVFALTQWGILSVVAHLGSPEEVGALTVATALVTPVFFFATMSIGEAHRVDDLDSFSRADYFALRLLMAFLSVLVVCALVALFYRHKDALVLTTTFAFMAVKVIGAQSQMNHSVFQREERLDFVAGSMIARGCSGLAGFAITYALCGLLWAAFLVEAAMWLLAVLVIDQHYLKRLNVTDRFSSIFRVKRASLWKLFVWTLPLGLAGFLMNATISAPRLVLDSFYNLAAVGLFGAIAYVSTALTTVTNALSSASAARLRRTIRDGRHKALLKLSLALIGLSALIGIALVGAAAFLGETVLSLLYGAAYIDVPLFVIVICATALRLVASPMQLALTAGHAYWRRLGVNGADFAVTVIAALILVPESGASGAAWSMVVGAVTRTLLLTYFFVLLVASVQPPGTAPREMTEPAE